MPNAGPGLAGDAVTRTGKSKLAASLLAIFLGGLGIHKFYLGDTKMGVIYLVFCCTFIPFIIGVIEGIVWLTQPNDVWLAKMATPDRVAARRSTNWFDRGHYMAEAFMR